MAKPIVLFIELKIAAKSKYVCEITEKLFLNNISTSIYAVGNVANKIDSLLWTWKQESFIPHKICDANEAVNGQILICDSISNLPLTQALILHDPLSLEVFKNYQLIVDFAEVYHAEKKTDSRKRFKQLRDSAEFDVHFTHLGALLSKESIKLNS